MAYFFAFIFASWGLIYFFLRDRGGPMKEMRSAQAVMESTTNVEEKRNAAKSVLDIIERENLAGVVVEDASKAAKLVLSGT